MTTFAVDDVEPAPERARTVALRELVGPHLVLGGDPDVRVLPARGAHPLLAAVHHAFVEHRALVLSPDAVWLTIAQGVAQHVRLHAEELRPRLVRHAGKQVLEVVAGDEPVWRDVVGAFRRAIGAAIGDGRARLFACDFSTTTDAERVASEIVLADAMSRYFDYLVSIVCGIPTITLTGTPADWRAIRARVDVLAELGLEVWARSLAPIADRFVDAVEGRPDRAWFQAIYKPRKAYGWDRVTGWIARLYPYVRSDRGDFSAPNPLFELPIDELPADTGPGPYFEGAGIRTQDPPIGPSRVLVRLAPSGGLVALEGGLLAVEQDAEGRLVPRAGYVVRHDAGADLVVERLRGIGVPADATDGQAWVHDAQLRALFEAVREATIATPAGPWRLLPPAERVRVRVAPGPYRQLAVTRVLDLPDDAFIALADTGQPVRLARGLVVPAGPPADDAEAFPFETTERADRIPVVAESLLGLLARVLDGDTSLTGAMTLLDVDPWWWDTPYHAAPLFERLGRALPERDAFDGFELAVGDATWRALAAPREKFVQLSRWMTVELRIDLGDGTALAILRRPERRILRLRLDAVVEATRRWRSTQPLVEIPVLGRTLVEILTYVLDHGRLPAPIATAADLVE